MFKINGRDYERRLNVATLNIRWPEKLDVTNLRAPSFYTLGRGEMEVELRADLPMTEKKVRINFSVNAEPISMSNPMFTGRYLMANKCHPHDGVWRYVFTLDGPLTRTMKTCRP